MPKSVGKRKKVVMTSRAGCKKNKKKGKKGPNFSVPSGGKKRGRLVVRKFWLRKRKKKSPKKVSAHEASGNNARKGGPHHTGGGKRSKVRKLRKTTFQELQGEGGGNLNATKKGKSPRICDHQKRNRADKYQWGPAKGLHI